MLRSRTVLRIGAVIGILLIALFADVLDPDRSDLVLPVFSSLITAGVIFLAAAVVGRRYGNNDKNNRRQRKRENYN